MKKLILTAAFAVLTASLASAEWITVSPDGYDFAKNTGKLVQNVPYVAGANFTADTHSEVFAQNWDDNDGAFGFTVGNLNFINNLKDNFRVASIGNAGKAFCFIGANVNAEVNRILRKYEIDSIAPLGLNNPFVNLMFQAAKEGHGNGRYRMTMIYNIYAGSGVTQDFATGNYIMANAKATPAHQLTTNLSQNHHLGAIEGSANSEAIAENQWNPEKWMKYEVEFDSPNDAPIFLKLGIGGWANGVNNFAFFLKELKFEFNDEAAEGRANVEATLTPMFIKMEKAVVSGVENIATADSELQISIKGNSVDFGTEAKIYNVSGTLVAQGTDAVLSKGFYVAATADGRTAKFAIR